MCLITKKPELMALYRQRVAYGQDPVKVSEYVKGLENKRNNNKSIVGVKKIIDYRIARENAIKTARHYELRITREKITQLKAELAQKDAKIVELEKKPVRKPREPEYWEGQIETEGGWRFESKEYAKIYAKSLKADEAVEFMCDWDEAFVEKKEKKSGKRNLFMKPPKEGLKDECRCEAFKWNYGEKIHQRCSNEAKKDRAGRRICGRCNQTAEEQMKKLLGWKIEFGTREGWYDEDRETIERRKMEHKLDPNYEPKRRGKKV
jgi:hypothetical protein